VSYLDDRLSASASLTEDGQTVTLTYVGGATYVPATGTTSGAAADPQTVAGVILPANMQSQRFQKDGSSLIVAGDQQLLLSALNTSGVAITPPQVNATITDSNSKVWTLISIDPLSPNGTDILFDCIIRRAV
jgi:hypothetical protein